MRDFRIKKINDVLLVEIISIYFKVINSVKPKGAAGRAGIKDGDRIIVINGKNVEKLSHKEAAGTIKESKKETKFEVLAYECDPMNPELG